MPNAVAIVSPVNDGSKTTKAPCTPESAKKMVIFLYCKYTILTVYGSVIGVKSERSALSVRAYFYFLKHGYMPLDNSYDKICQKIVEK